MRSLYLTVLAGALCLGCGASTQSARFVKAAPLSADHVVRIFSTKLPACDYEELGIVQGEPQTGFTRMQAVLDKMTAEARHMGGDAIITLRQASALTANEGGAVSLDSSIALTGVVVRFKVADCTS
jgi:uncharacterized protein YbjQ (UPF0145 family)